MSRSTSRRHLLTRSALGAAGLAGLAVLGREVVRVRDGALAVLRDTGSWSDPITANEDFYTVSKNFRDPSEDGDSWSITLDGLVASPRTFTRADLEALAGTSDFVSTLTCISNEVGGPLISTARWTGAPLAALLAEAEILPGAAKVVLHGRDDYTDSIPIGRATAPEPHIVWRMNGVDLPDAHGFPVRAIVPGLYGIKNVKWLERIEVTDDADYEGYWQRRDWTDTAVIKTSSRFDLPVDRAIVPVADAQLAGVAFGGDRGISRVEVSTDDGETWQDATITDQPGPPISWVRWSLPWSPDPGTYTLVVRATDGTGALQPPDRDPPLPDGSSGWHTVSVGIVAD